MTDISSFHMDGHSRLVEFEVDGRCRVVLNENYPELAHARASVESLMPVVLAPMFEQFRDDPDGKLRQAWIRFRGMPAPPPACTLRLSQNEQSVLLTFRTLAGELLKEVKIPRSRIMEAMRLTQAEYDQLDMKIAEATTRLRTEQDAERRRFLLHDIEKWDTLKKDNHAIGAAVVAKECIDQGVGLTHRFMTLDLAARIFGVIYLLYAEAKGWPRRPLGADLKTRNEEYFAALGC